MDEKFKVLYGLHRIVTTTTSVHSHLVKTYTDGKPEIVLTVNGLGIPRHDYIYRVSGSDGQKQYEEAVRHLTEIIKLKAV
jgi:hypothetical protein